MVRNAVTNPIRPPMKSVTCAALAALSLAVPAQAQDQLSPFVHANAVHTLYHELAHALIDQFRIPILGQEEDAADNFATLELARIFEDDAKPMLADVATSWLMQHADIPDGQLDFYDNHDLGAQRAYRTVCMLYGLDRDAHLDVARWAALPEDLYDICEESALITRDSWEAVLDPTLRGPGDPEPDVTLEFRPPEYNNVLKVRLEQSGLLQAFAQDIRTSFAWPEPIQIVAMTCNEPNAFWNPETRSIEFCYEILGDWMTQERLDTRRPDAMFRQPPEPTLTQSGKTPQKNTRD